MLTHNACKHWLDLFDACVLIQNIAHVALVFSWRCVHRLLAPKCQLEDSVTASFCPTEQDLSLSELWEGLPEKQTSSKPPSLLHRSLSLTASWRQPAERRSSRKWLAVLCVAASATGFRQQAATLVFTKKDAKRIAIETNRL